MKTKRRQSRQRDEQPPITPIIHFRRMNRCFKCGARREVFEFVIMDEQPGERSAQPEELMTYGFYVPPGSVDLVATLIAQQFETWNGRTSSIHGADLADHSFVEPISEEQSPSDQLKERIGSLIQSELTNQERLTARYGPAIERIQAGLESVVMNRKLPNDLCRRVTAGPSRAPRPTQVVEVAKKARRPKP